MNSVLETIEKGFFLLHLPTEESLGHRVDLVITSSIGERGAFLKEVVDPGRICGCGR